MTTRDITTQELVERAAWHGALSTLFARGDDETFSRLQAAIAQLDPALAGPDGAHLLRRFIDVLRMSGPDGLRAERSRLFAGPAMCRTNETDYERLSFNMTQRLADVTGFFEAFGYEVADGAGERPDFAGTELEFTRVLLLKQAYAMERGWPDEARLAEEAASAFIRDHLLFWMPALCDKLIEAADDDGIFASGARLMAAFLESEKGRVHEGEDE
ncbi:MAG: TorD/DmsD family molecular chaperone [Chloroflexota bacterium]